MSRDSRESLVFISVISAGTVIAAQLSVFRLVWTGCVFRAMPDSDSNVMADSIPAA